MISKSQWNLFTSLKLVCGFDNQSLLEVVYFRLLPILFPHEMEITSNWKEFQHLLYISLGS